MAEAALSQTGNFAAELGAILAAFKVLTPSSFSFGDESPIDAAAASIGADGPAQYGYTFDTTSSSELLARAIQATLYDRCYMRRMDRSGAEQHTVAYDAELVRDLSAANTGQERWDPGWTLYQFGVNGQALVRKGERERIAMPGAFVSHNAPGTALQVGAHVSLRAPRMEFGVQPGYCFVFGETLEEVADQLSLVRVYLHCPPGSIKSLLTRLIAALDRFQIPFQLKAPTAPALYDRTDAVVLYVGARYFSITARILESAQTEDTLAPEVPLFTKRLWPGVGVAVDPGTGESFGAHRCRLTARGIVDAWDQGRTSAQAVFAAVAGKFSEAGLDVTRPYLGPGWVDMFELPGTVVFR